MSLVYRCLEDLGHHGSNYMMSAEEAAKYTVDDGAFIINMESLIALDGIYETEYALECAYVESCSRSKYAGTPVEEGIGSAMSKVKSSMGKLWSNIKAFFRKLKEAVYRWFENVKKFFRELFAKPKDIVKDIKPDDYSCRMDGDVLVIEAKKDLPSVVANQSSASRSSTRTAAPERVKDFPSVSVRKPSNNSTPDASAVRGGRPTGIGRKAKTVTISEFHMYTYSNMDRWPRLLREEYFQVNDVIDEVVGTIVTAESKIYAKLSNRLEDSRSTTALSINSNGPDGSATTKARELAAKVIDEIGNKLNQGVDELFGTVSPEDENDFCWRYFRNGATSNKNTRVVSGNVTNLISDAKKALIAAKDLDNIQFMQSEVNRAYDRIISMLDKYSKSVDEATPGSLIPTAVSKVTTGFNRFRSRTDKMTHAYIDACKERNAVYIKVISAIKRM